MSADSSDTVLSLVDITEQRAREAALEALAHTDPLTGLPIRLALQRTLKLSAGAEGLCRRARRPRPLQADEFGHAIGDKLLQAVAAAGPAAQPGVSVPDGRRRVLVVMPGPLDAASMDCLQQLRQVTGSRAPLADYVGAVSVTIGVAHSSAGSVNGVMRQCDMAMYAAKARGRNQVAVYGPDAVSHVGQHAKQAECWRVGQSS